MTAKKKVLCQLTVNLGKDKQKWQFSEWRKCLSCMCRQWPTRRSETCTVLSTGICKHMFFVNSRWKTCCEIFFFSFKEWLVCTECRVGKPTDLDQTQVWEVGAGVQVCVCSARQKSYCAAARQRPRSQELCRRRKTKVISRLTTFDIRKQKLKNNNFFVKRKTEKILQCRK